MSSPSTTELTILYPLCPSHSGSTLFSILIGSQDHICGVGELFVFSSRPQHLIQKKEEKCSCNGQTKEGCPFWQKVDAFLSSEYNMTLDDLDVESSDPDVLKLHNEYLFTAISKVSECKIIVDASKVVSRFVQLREAGFNVVPLLFKRDPRALVYSWIKRNYDWRRVAQFYPDYYQEVAKNIPDRQVMPTTYESFIKQPQATLRQLLDYLGLPQDAIELDWTKKQHHTLKGNAVRFQNNAKLKESREWHNHLTSWQKFVIWVKAFPCKVDNYWIYFLWARFTRLFIWQKYT